jgi:hypothetical protein
MFIQAIAELTIMTIDLSSFNEALQNDPMQKAGADLCAAGVPINRVIFNEETGDVLMSENGGPYERAHAFIKAMVTGTVYRDPGQLNPAASYAVRRSPQRKATHDAEVVSMMRYLLDYYRADLLTHPALDRVLEEMAAVNDSPAARKGLSALDTNYDRWDLLIESVVDNLDSR